MLYVKRRGRGKPTLFLAGLSGSTRYWNGFNTLPGRSLFVDLLGFGNSPKPDMHYTLDTHLNALHEAVRHEKELTIVAHSFGCVIAAYYAVKYPKQVKRLILIGAPVFKNAVEARTAIQRFAPAMAFLTFHPSFGRPSCWLHNTFPRASRYIARRIVTLPAPVADDCLLHTWRSYRDTMDVLLKCPLPAALQSIGRKTVFIHGNQDPISPLKKVKRLAQSTGAVFVETGDTHHSYVYGNAEKTLAIIRKYAWARR